jgi:hypothetical protein
MAASLPCRLTVLMKYPLDQHAPPHSCRLTDDTRWNISRAVVLLIVVTILLDCRLGPIASENGRDRGR